MQSIFVPSSLHYQRVGRKITPIGIVWHCTAMPPGTELSLVKVWNKVPGRGNAAHALIRRNGTIIGLCDFFHNANHAGGKTGGKIGYNNKLWYANSCTVGIELSNPGRVCKDSSGWRIAYTGSDRVYLNADCEIVTDEELDTRTKRDSWGWVKYTAEQIDSARKIAEVAWELGVTNRPVVIERATVNGIKYPNVFCGSMAIRHSDLDPSRKSDPGDLFVPESVLNIKYTKRPR